MGLEEPEVLIELASKLGEKIGGNGVTQIVGLLDAFAQGVGVVGHVVYKELEHGGPVGGGKVGFLQTGLRGCFADGAVRHATQGGDAFGDAVGLLFQV